jgi:hypothetical protein
VQQENKAFFFEGKKQKTSGYKRPSLIDATSVIRKSFLVLFFKKERLRCYRQWWDIPKHLTIDRRNAVASVGWASAHHARGARVWWAKAYTTEATDRNPYESSV